MNNYFNEKNLHSVDVKGRVLVPKDVRDHHRLKKGDILHCVPSLTNPAYIEIRTDAQWKKYREDLRGAEQGEQKKDSFRYADLFNETATVDGQGRVSIPQRIREMCKIADSVAIVDMDEHIEVWARENIEQKYADMVKAFKEVNDRMFGRSKD
jgi:division/cell wall cluster transcriptional repressor MraZ